jgi:hypothetical protein
MYCARYRRAGASQGARAHVPCKFSSPTGPQCLRRPDPPVGASKDDRIGKNRVGRTPAESISQPMSEAYVDPPILVSLVFFLILRHTPPDMSTSWADLR